MPNTTNNFEFIRLAAATLVILGHSYDLTGTRGPLWYDAGVAGFSVRIFFVVSGYLICQSWISDPNIFRFIIKRILRLFPALLLVVCFSALIIGPIMTTMSLIDYFQDASFLAYFRNIQLEPNFILPGVFTHNGPFTAVNGSLWTLPMEFAMYVAVPFYASRLRFARLFALPLIVVVSIVAGVYFEVYAPTQVQPVYHWTSIPSMLKLAPYFIIGAAIGLWRLERFLNLQTAIVLLGLLTCFINSSAVYHTAIIIFVPYVTLAFALSDCPLFSTLSAKRDISYGVYLWAFPIQQVLIATVGPELSAPALFGMATVLTCGIAYLSARFVEEPAMRWKPRRRVNATPLQAGSVKDLLPEPAV